MAGINSWINAALLVTAGMGVGYGVWNQWYADQQPAKLVRTPQAAVPLAVAPKEPFSKNDMESFQKLKLMYATGDFGGALKLAQELLASQAIEPSFREWLNRQLAPLLTSVAWVKIQLGDCDEALKSLYRASQLGPVAETRKGLGFCLHASKSWPEAASWLAGYILERPQDADARLLYADSLESLGRFDEAVMTLEGAAAIEDLSQERKDLIAARLQAMKVKAREGVKQKSEYSRRFYVSFREEEHDRYLAIVFETLESAMDEFSEALGIPAPEAPIEVVLYRREAFHEAIPGGPQWSEGVFDGRIRVPVSAEMADDPRGLLATVLRHELTHALLAQKGGGRFIPPWFDEGMAQYLSCRGRPCAQVKFGATPGAFSESKMLSEPFVTLSSIDAGRAYSHSLYAIRMIVHERGADALRNIVRDIPAQGPLNSDQLATIAGYPDFSMLVQSASGFWKQKAIF